MSIVTFNVLQNAFHIFTIHGNDMNFTSEIKQAKETTNAASKIATLLDERLILRDLMDNNTSALGGLHIDEVLNLICQTIRDHKIESATRSTSMVPDDDKKFQMFSKICQKVFILIKMITRAQMYLYLQDEMSQLSDTSDLDELSYTSDTSDLEGISHRSDTWDLDGVSYTSDTSELDEMSHRSDTSDLDGVSHFSETSDLYEMFHHSDTSDSRIEINTNLKTYLKLIINDFWTLTMMKPYIGLNRDRWSVNIPKQIYFLIMRNDSDSMETARTAEHWLSFFTNALTFSYIYYDDINEVRQNIKPSSVPSNIYIIGHGTQESVGCKSGNHLVNRVNLLHCINDCFRPLDTKKYRDRRNAKRHATVVLTECFGHKYYSKKSEKEKKKLFRNIRIVTLTSDTMEKTFFGVRNENIPLLYYILKFEFERLLS